MAYNTDTAICLRVTDFSETSQIVALLTHNSGLLSLLAKGSKRPNTTGSSKFSGPLDLLAAGEILFIPPKSGAELGALFGWQLTDQRNNLRKNLPAIYAATIAAEITLALLQPHDPHPQLLVELEATLALLASPQRPRVLLAYAKALLIDTGYRPLFATCASCGSPLSADEFVSYLPAAGGVLCRSCKTAPQAPRGKSMDMPRKIALALDRLEPPTILLAHPTAPSGDPRSLRIAMDLMLFHIESIGNRAIRTRSFLDAVFATI